jgi:hypothetical protein
MIAPRWWNPDYWHVLHTVLWASLGIAAGLTSRGEWAFIAMCGFISGVNVVPAIRALCRRPAKPDAATCRVIVHMGPTVIVDRTLTLYPGANQVIDLDCGSIEPRGRKRVVDRAELN